MINLSNEELRRIHIEYLSDRRITTLFNEIAAIYSTAIPKGLIKSKIDGTTELIFDEKVLYLVNTIKSKIDQIIRTDYKILVEKNKDEVAISKEYGIVFGFWYYHQRGKVFKVKECSSKGELNDIEGFSSYELNEIFIVTEGEFKGNAILKKHCEI